MTRTPGKRETRKAREWWIAVHDDGSACTAGSSEKEALDRALGTMGHKHAWGGSVIKVREVISMIKKLEITHPNSCLSKAGDDEPIFVLRAKDPIASDVVRWWADVAAAREAHEPEKLAEALALADAMDEWRRKVAK